MIQRKTNKHSKKLKYDQIRGLSCSIKEKNVSFSRNLYESKLRKQIKSE